MLYDGAAVALETAAWLAERHGGQLLVLLGEADAGKAKRLEAEGNPLTKQGGVIYIRALNEYGKWDSLPICPSCWNRENPEKKVEI